MSFSPKQGLVERRGLDASDLDEITRLAQLCNEHEGLDLKLNWNILRKRPSDQLNDFLYYADDGQLVGFLPLFSFSPREGEISGMVHPAYRRRGIFKALFEAALQESRRRSLPSLLLIAEQASPAGQAFVRNLPTISYDHSEYKMVLEEPRLPSAFNERLQFRPARSTDVQIFRRITAQAFEESEDEVDWYTEQSFSQPDRLYYVGEVDGVVVGKIDVSLLQDANLILGFAVSPEHQRHGYGRQILAHTVQELLKRGQQSIWLEVVTNNKQALALYQSCGFKETGSYDYYRLPLEN